MNRREERIGIAVAVLGLATAAGVYVWNAQARYAEAVAMARDNPQMVAVDAYLGRMQTLADQLRVVADCIDTGGSGCVAAPATTPTTKPMEKAQ